ncbi:hypothetical protein Hanom_Chr02g00166331 [Helianthus anomalus]
MVANEYGDQRLFTCDRNLDFVDFCDVNQPGHPAIIKMIEGYLLQKRLIYVYLLLMSCLLMGNSNHL